MLFVFCTLEVLPGKVSTVHKPLSTESAERVKSKEENTKYFQLYFRILAGGCTLNIIEHRFVVCSVIFQDGSERKRDEKERGTPVTKHEH